MEKITFEPTVRHYTLLQCMDEETKSALKFIVSTLGYYNTISVLNSECGKLNSEATILADIGCYMLEDYEYVYHI